MAPKSLDGAFSLVGAFLVRRHTVHCHMLLLDETQE